MFRPYSQDQLFLLPPSLQDFIEETHPAHMINDLVERMDLSVLEKRYGTMGQPAYVPRMMLKVILYGFTVGVFSARKLKRACRENLAFQYLAGMERPAFKTFIEFRQRHRQDMRDVFLQTVKLAREMGLVLLARVALDGSKIAADTSKHKAMSYGRMQEEGRKLKAEIEALLRQAEEADAKEDQEFGADSDGYSLSEELTRREARLRKIEEAQAALEAREAKDHPGEPIDPKKQISFADPEARCFAKGGGGVRYVHNAQVAVDMDSQIIVENHIEDSVSDAGAVEPALQNMQDGLGSVPDQLVVDGGYANTGTLDACEGRGVEPVCAAGRAEEAPAEVGSSKEAPEPEAPVAPAMISAFAYEGKTHTFTCPHGLRFVFDHWNRDGSAAIYRSDVAGECGCGTFQRQDGRRFLRVRTSHLAQRKLRQILDRPENRMLYSRRKCTVEPVLGQIKCGIGFDRFLYRGRAKTGSEWNLVCAAANLKKMALTMIEGNAPRPALAPVYSRAAAVLERLIRHGAHGLRSSIVLIMHRIAPKLIYV
jgi:transposase